VIRVIRVIRAIRVRTEPDAARDAAVRAPRVPHAGCAALASSDRSAPPRAAHLKNTTVITP